MVPCTITIPLTHLRTLLHCLFFCAAGFALSKATWFHVIVSFQWEMCLCGILLFHVFIFMFSFFLSSVVTVSWLLSRESSL